MFNNIQGQMFNTNVGVRQGSILSSVIFNLFLGEIMAVIKDEHISTISIGGRTLSNLRFADDIDLIADFQSSCQIVIVGLQISA